MAAARRTITDLGVSEVVTGDEDARTDLATGFPAPSGTHLVEERTCDVPRRCDAGSVEPWLSDRQQQVWRTYLAMWRMLGDRIERDMQQYGGMPHAYYLILAMLSESPDRRVRMNRLAEIVGFSQSRLSHAVARLELLGWVLRQQAAADKRGQIAVLTDAGYTRLVEVAPLHAKTVRSTMFDPLDDDQLAAFESICTTILRARADFEAQIRTMDPLG